MRLIVSLTAFLILFTNSIAQQPLPVPKALNEPWNIIYIADDDSEFVTRLMATSDEGFSITSLDLSVKLADGKSRKADAVIIDSSSIQNISSEDLQWIADAYWQRGLVIVGFNMTRSSFRRIVGTCTTAEDKPVWWESEGPYFILSSRIVHSVYEADHVRKIDELTSCDNSSDKTDYLGYITESNFAAAYFLTTDEEYRYMFENLSFALENLSQSRMNFARYLVSKPGTDFPDVIDILLSQGMSQDQIDEIFAERSENE